MKSLFIGVVAYQRPEALHVLLRSLLAQTNQDFFCKVYHDGYDPKIELILRAYRDEYPEQIDFEFTPTRYNDFGHSLRQMAINDAQGDYLLITNDDNYYVPVFIENMIARARKDDSDLVLCDMVHSYDRPGRRDQIPYNFFETFPRKFNIDVGAMVARTEIAKLVGWRDLRSVGDGTYCDDIVASKDHIKISKVSQILFVHN